MRRAAVAVMLVALLLGGMAEARAVSLVAPVYPDSTPVGPADPGDFLSKNSFDEVRAFYLRDRGHVTREETHAERGRMAFFEYMDVREVQRHDPVGSAIGVRIYSRPRRGVQEPATSLPVVGDIFGKLKLLLGQGSLSRTEYDALVERYSSLAAWYYPLTGKSDASGRAETVDAAINRRCEAGGAQGESQAQEMEALGRRAEELMTQGRQREAMDLMRRMGQMAQSVHEQSSGIEGVEKWKNCLEELEENGYQTRIEVALDPAGN